LKTKRAKHSRDLSCFARFVLPASAGYAVEVDTLTESFLLRSLMNKLCAIVHENLVSAMFVALPQFVRVKCATAKSGERTDRRAFLAARYAADCSAGRCCSGERKFVSVLLPESTMTAMAVTPRLCRMG
jgi:hypothetical protein